MKKFSNRDLLLYVMLIALIIFTIQTFLQMDEGQKPIYSEVRTFLEQEKVRSVSFAGSELILVLDEVYETDNILRYEIYDFELFYRDFNDLVVSQYQRGIIQWYDYPESIKPSLLETLLPSLIMVAVFALFMFLMIGRSGRMQGGGNDLNGGVNRSKGKEEPKTGKKVTFNDVAGADEEKNELEEIVDFLRDPEKYIALGARIPKGILLEGPPGTGKTLLARAVAGEAGVQFLNISGSDFVEKYVGVGASRVRELFTEAKNAAPSIVFIDEIDAVGRQRGSGLGGGHDEREQTLNQLLVEMDGFSNNEGVIVLAATNRKDILDPALLRPGRFDRQIYIGQPDVKGREAILKVHAKGKPIGEDVSLKDIAHSTVGFTGADLENLLNEGALMAARRNGRFIVDADLREAMLKVMAGPEKKSYVISEKEKRLVAYHEAGHAVASFGMEEHDPVHTITIIPRGGAGGMTIYQPKEDKNYQTKTQISQRIVTALGGRVAEELFLDDISSGAGSDLRAVTALARAMVTRYGMSDKVGNLVFDESGNEIFIGRSMAQQRSYSEEAASLIDREIKRIVDEAYTECRRILTQRREKIEQIAAYLMEHETMGAELFEEMMV